MKERLPYALALFFLLAALFLLFQKSEIEAKFQQLQADYNKSVESRRMAEAELELSKRALSKKEEELGAIKLRLSEKEMELNKTAGELAKISSELEKERKNAAETEARLSALKEKLDAVEEAVNSSIGWFRENAYLPANYSWTTEIFKQRAIADCIDKNELNLACISFDMENTAFAIHYRLDSEKGVQDKLQSVKETISLGWGDCEDYSLLFKAALNSIEKERGGLAAYGWRSGGGGEFRVYPKESIHTEEYYYYPNARKGYAGNLSSLQAYVVCYTVSSLYGHCAVALSERKLAKSSEVLEMDGMVFEPQNGEYLGRIGEKFQICTAAECLEKPNYIHRIISDGDLYIFSKERGWESYADYLQQVRALKAGLEA
ncbi:MAG: hypothetical protein N3G22_02320 [Candidatus Micrarchaeota archaeon]|nr:hypothetical protein [Candidatus Micrarchaeota archaeon]